eukprot:scaffold5807_cov412-Prasinococcus_capsulatus_cf.AAC.8
MYEIQPGCGRARRSTRPASILSRRSAARPGDRGGARARLQSMYRAGSPGGSLSGPGRPQGPCRSSSPCPQARPGGPRGHPARPGATRRRANGESS